MSIFSVTSSQKLLAIRARTNNNCIICGQFVGLDEQSFEHIYNKKENAEWLKNKNIGEHHLQNLAIAHDRCNKNCKQTDKKYDYVSAFSLPTMENNKDSIVKAFIGLYLNCSETALKFAFNRYEEKYRIKGELKNKIESAINTELEQKKLEYQTRKANLLKQLQQLDNEFLG